MMKPLTLLPHYDEILGRIVGLLEAARRASARAVNSVMTATYWEIGRQIVEGEQQGADRAEYGARMVERLSDDLTARFGRGFGIANLRHMRAFYLAWPEAAIRQTPSSESLSPYAASSSNISVEISQTPSAKSPSLEEAALRKDGGTPCEQPATGILQTPSEEFASACGQSISGLSTEIAQTLSAQFPVTRTFPLPWSHYVRLLSVEDPEARAFYETEALRGGWSVRQLDRQIDSNACPTRCWPHTTRWSCPTSNSSSPN
jgi:hypothetical protein